MRNNIITLLLVFTLLVIITSCTKTVGVVREEIVLHDTTVKVGNTPATSTFSNYPAYLKGEPVKLKWTGSDPEGSPTLKLIWYSNGSVIGEGDSISFVPASTGSYNVSLQVQDGNTSSTTSKEIKVLDDLRVVVKLVSLNFYGNNVGDGAGISTPGYITSTGLAMDHNKAKVLRVSAFPSSDPSKANGRYQFHPNTTFNFTSNSGLIILDSSISSPISFSVSVVDYDERSFNWFGFFTTLFESSKTILTAYAPEYAVIPEALGKITDAIQSNIKLRPEDNVIGNFRVQLEPGNNHWGSGNEYLVLDPSYNIGIKYRVDVIY